jgi:hypothetical protein
MNAASRLARRGESSFKRRPSSNAIPPIEGASSPVTVSSFWMPLVTTAPLAETTGFSGVMNSALPKKRLIAHVVMRDEAGRVLLRLAFEDLGLHRVIGRLEARNTASARVLERLGMRREAHLVENEYVKEEWQSELVYAILDREWAGSGGR